MPDHTKVTRHLKGLENCFVAGGAITSLYTNQPINDIDVYPKSATAMENAIYWAFDEGYWCSHASERAITFTQTLSDKESIDIQIMHFDEFETAAKIFDAFDFTCCMGAYDLDEKKFVLHDMFLEHCSQRFLSFNKGTRFPYASGWRVNKYRDRGFTIGKIEFQKILMACAERPINSWKDLREQVGGVYGEAITIPDDEEFTKEGMWKALDTLTFAATTQGYESAVKAVAAITRREIPYFETAKQIFAKYSEDEGFEAVDEKPKNGKLVTMAEIFPAMTFYKKVMVKDGRYFGPHQTSFEYKIGEIQKSEGPGIFAYSTIEKARGHYSTGSNQVILELKPTCPEDIIIGSDWGSQGVINLKNALSFMIHPLTKTDTVPPTTIPPIPPAPPSPFDPDERRF